MDDEVASVCAAVAQRMTATGLGGEELRERAHLDPFVKDEFEARGGARPVSRVLAAETFPGLGPVDVVVKQPRLLMELKWSYEPPGKVFESLWDTIKLSILGPIHDFQSLYIATGAATEEWERSESADLFVTGSVDPLDLWGRRLDPPRGPNNGTTVGEDLVIGARGNQPSAAPVGLGLRLVASFPVAQDFELKLVAVDAASELRPWPHTDAVGV